MSAACQARLATLAFVLSFGSASRLSMVAVAARTSARIESNDELSSDKVGELQTEEVEAEALGELNRVNDHSAANVTQGGQDSLNVSAGDFAYSDTDIQAPPVDFSGTWKLSSVSGEPDEVYRRLGESWLTRTVFRHYGWLVDANVQQNIVQSGHHFRNELTSDLADQLEEYTVGAGKQQTHKDSSPFERETSWDGASLLEKIWWDGIFYTQRTSFSDSKELVMEVDVNGSKLAQVYNRL